MTDASKVSVERSFSVARTGTHRTLFFFSSSGGMVTDGSVPFLSGHIDGTYFEIQSPIRIAEATFRGSPQFSDAAFAKFFNVDRPRDFPLQVFAFPAVSEDEAASLSYWFGPETQISSGSPELPRDTIVVCLHGADSGNRLTLVERYILEPFTLWLRVLSGQWWIGRSLESVSGSLHFVAQIDAADKVLGAPIPVSRMTTADRKFRAIDIDVWTEAGNKLVSDGLPLAHQVLFSDAKFMIASREHRSGVTLASSAIESYRDFILGKRNMGLSSLPCSKTDLLKHLSTGFKKVFGSSIESDEAAFTALQSLWIARGEAAHGKPIMWRSKDGRRDIRDVPISEPIAALNTVMGWLQAIDEQTDRKSG